MTSEPKITGVTLTPNPAVTGSAGFISVAIIDADLAANIAAPISGAALAGESLVLIKYTEAV